jgi:hypothetical protein
MPLRVSKREVHADAWARLRHNLFGIAGPDRGFFGGGMVTGKKGWVRCPFSFPSTLHHLACFCLPEHRGGWWWAVMAPARRCRAGAVVSWWQEKKRHHTGPHHAVSGGPASVPVFALPLRRCCGWWWWRRERKDGCGALFLFPLPHHYQPRSICRVVDINPYIATLQTPRRADRARFFRGSRGRVSPLPGPSGASGRFWGGFRGPSRLVFRGFSGSGRDCTCRGGIRYGFCGGETVMPLQAVPWRAGRCGKRSRRR